MTYNYCTSQAIINKAGANVDSTAKNSGDIIDQFADSAEAYVCAATRYDWISASGAIITGYPNIYRIISEVISSTAAIDLISYNFAGYTGRGEAEDLINVLYDKRENGINYLKNMKKPEVVIT